MLRRNPTRIPLRAEDVEQELETNQYQMQLQQNANIKEEKGTKDTSNMKEEKKKTTKRYNTHRKSTR